MSLGRIKDFNRYVYNACRPPQVLNSSTSMWVPGHSNVQGNEQVDRLANTAFVTGNSLDIDLY